MNYILDNYFGFGDNIYKIPFVHKLAQQGEVFIYTPFPEMFQMPNVYCFKLTTNLKLQLQNMTGNGLYSHGHKANGQRIRFNYGENFKASTPLAIMQSFEKQVPLDGEFYFEFKYSSSTKADDIVNRAKHKHKKLCIMRLPSVRKEWACYTRAPLMEYFQICIDYLRQDYYIVTIGDIGNKEAYTGIEPSLIDERRDRHNVNHLGIWDAYDLISKADLIVSMPCNILPICQILRKKSFFIYGGYVPHAMCNDERFYQVGYVEPDPFCFCIHNGCLLYTSPSPRDGLLSRMPSSA